CSVPSSSPREVLFPISTLPCFPQQRKRARLRPKTKTCTVSSASLLRLYLSSTCILLSIYDNRPHFDPIYHPSLSRQEKSGVRLLVEARQDDRSTMVLLLVLRRCSLPLLLRKRPICSRSART
ncbi:unnamed protein product, partial [Mycena citricolor]